MDSDIPQELSMKEFLKHAFKTTCIRLSGFYTEAMNIPQKEALAVANKTYQSMVEPWLSLPDVETAPMEILHVAKNVALHYFNREAGRPSVDKLAYKYEEYAEAMEKISKDTRILYDDIINTWHDRPK